MKAEQSDLLLELWMRRRNAKQIVWTTKDGTEIPINEMSDEHLINTINMLSRNVGADEGDYMNILECGDR